MPCTHYQQLSRHKRLGSAGSKKFHILLTGIPREFTHYYGLDFKKNKSGKAKKCKFSYIPTSLPAIPNEKLTLVVIRGLGKIPMMLITNLNPTDKKLSLAILKVYLKRWRIEEYFRFKTQQFDFENIRVRSLNSIRTMNLLLSIIIGFIAMLSQRKKESILVLLILKTSKRIYGIPEFDYYALADGIYAILKKQKLVLKNS